MVKFNATETNQQEQTVAQLGRTSVRMLGSGAANCRTLNQTAKLKAVGSQTCLVDPLATSGTPMLRKPTIHGPAAVAMEQMTVRPDGSHLRTVPVGARHIGKYVGHQGLGDADERHEKVLI